MDVFISWSGVQSKLLAEALRSWLPSVLQSARPWMSDVDLDKGARWSSDIASRLQNTRVGIICLTSENLEAPWILFEAGALSKTLESTFVCPYLFQVDPAALKGPLVQFQATRSEREDTRKLLHTINSAMGAGSLTEKQLNEAFDVWWPRLEVQLRSIPQRRDRLSPPRRTDRELIEEMLELVRNLARIRLMGSQMPMASGPTIESFENSSETSYRNLEEAMKFLKSVRQNLGVVPQRAPSTSKEPRRRSGMKR